MILIALLPAISIHIYNGLELRPAREAELAERAHRVLVLIEAEKVRLAEGVRHVAGASPPRRCDAHRPGERSRSVSRYP